MSDSEFRVLVSLVTDKHANNSLGLADWTDISLARVAHHIGFTETGLVEQIKSLAQSGHLLFAANREWLCTAPALIRFRMKDPWATPTLITSVCNIFTDESPRMPFEFRRELLVFVTAIIARAERMPTKRRKPGGRDQHGEARETMESFKERFDLSSGDFSEAVDQVVWPEQEQSES